LGSDGQFGRFHRANAKKLIATQEGKIDVHGGPKNGSIPSIEGGGVYTVVRESKFLCGGRSRILHKAHEFGSSCRKGNGSRKDQCSYEQLGRATKIHDSKSVPATHLLEFMVITDNTTNWM
jgi:hypothetical protein